MDGLLWPPEKRHLIFGFSFCHPGANMPDTIKRKRGMKRPLIETERLIMRQWHETDHEPYARLNGSPDAMACLPHTLYRQESDARIRYFRSLIISQGWSVWALGRKSYGAFIGSAGLMEPLAPHPFSPCVEIGWRLDLPY